jgi:DNA (cytosine-5)-methyltransferase 1
MIAHRTTTVADSARRTKPPLLDFFAGSGLVTEALKGDFELVWANDISEKKAAVFRANHPANIFHQGPVQEIRGVDLPFGLLSWASFPCQDLSLAGKMNGLASARSGLVWQWLRVMDEMPRRPPLVVAENVVGLVTGAQGAHYRELHRALVKRGYRVGAVVLDAAHWVPQSRPRVFVVGVCKEIDTGEYQVGEPIWCHPKSVQRAAKGLKDWVWWNLKQPKRAPQTLQEIVSFDEPWDESAKTKYLLSLVPEKHRERMKLAIETGARVFPGYKRIRNGRQVLELRFDGLAGCLRTPEGGSSRQFLIVWHEGKLRSRLLAARETALLMGVRPTYRLPGLYNDAYRAMGDAVAVPAAQYLSQQLLSPLARAVLQHEVRPDSPAEIES